MSLNQYHDTYLHCQLLYGKFIACYNGLAANRFAGESKHGKHQDIQPVSR